VIYIYFPGHAPCISEFLSIEDNQVIFHAIAIAWIKKVVFRP